MHGSVHGLAHLFDVLDGGNSLPLGIPGAAGEPAPVARNLQPFYAHEAVVGDDHGAGRANSISMRWSF